MGNKIKPRERARVFIAYRALFVNTILIYDKNICCFLLIALVFSRFLKLQFYPRAAAGQEVFTDAAYSGACPPLCGGLSHDRRRRHGGCGRLGREGQPADADGAGAAALLLSAAVFRPRHHARDRDAGQSFDEVAELCRRLDVPYTRIQTPVYQIVFEERKEKNPCSLCAKLRRGSLNTALQQLGISKIALGHHYDDAIETLLMNLLFEGQIGCFQPVTYLDRSGITQIRPLLYCREDEVRRVVERLHLPVVHNPCPANGYSRRQEVKELIARDALPRHQAEALRQHAALSALRLEPARGGAVI